MTKLYHGTSERNLDAILAEGIKPRGKGRGNWKHTVTSNPKHVYLTSAYALYFAEHAVGSVKGEKLAVIEVDTARLNPFRLMPDEDWLEQVTRSGNGPAPVDRDMNYRTRWYRKRLAGFQEYWEKSVEGLGTCSYEGTVPASAITRIATLDQHTCFELVVQGMDPMISVANFRHCAIKYRNYIAWLFGDPLEEDPFALHVAYADPERFAALPANLQEMVTRSRDAGGIAVDRKGVAVFTPKDRIKIEA